MKNNSILAPGATLVVQGLWQIGLLAMSGALLNILIVTVVGSQNIDLSLQVGAPFVIAMVIFLATGKGHPKGIAWSVTGSLLAVLVLSSILVSAIAALAIAFSKSNPRQAWITLAVSVSVGLLARSLLSRRGLWVRNMQPNKTL